MKIASVMMGVVGSVVLVTSLLTVFVLPLDSMLLWGKIAVGLGMVLASLVLNWEGVKDASTKKGVAFVVSSVVAAVGLAIILGVANYFAHTHKTEIDLTKDKVFTLSDQTQKTLADLKEDVVITAFFRKDEAEAEVLKDLVDRYRTVSPRVKFETVNPDRAPNLVEKYKVTADGPRIVVESRGQDARIKELSEESLTNAILQVATKDKKKLYLTQGHGEPKPDGAEGDGIKDTVGDLQSQGYAVEPVNLVETQAIPQDTALLAIIGPTQAFFPPEVELIKGFLQKGGKVLLMVDPNVTTGLEELLKSFRLELGNNTILDVTQISSLLGQGPEAAIAFQYAEHKAMEGMENVATLFKGARSVSTLPGDDSIQAIELVLSNQRSWGETKIADGDWQWNVGELRGPVPMVALSTKDTKETEGKLSDQMRLMVFGDADLATNQYRVMAANRDLLLNSMAYLVEDENRISIRPKQRGASRIVLTPGQETLIAFLALDGMPVSLLAFGLGIWLVRRRR